MTWLMLGVLLVLILAALPARRALAARRERQLVEREAFRVNRKLVDEDVTVFGEQVAELHIDTLATELDPVMQVDYRTALTAYDQAKELFATATTIDQMTAVTTVLEDGRYARACLLARQDGTELPQRREECFFNPQHGPAMTEVTWTPPGGVERQVAVCASDARRLAGGLEPDIRLVRVGDRYVPWHAAPQERGLLAASIGTLAVGGVPKYVMLEADLDRTFDQFRGGSGAL